MKKNMLIIFLIGIIVGILATTLYASQGIIYVAGKYGRICYVSGTEHKNIVEKFFFSTLESCEQFIK